MSFAGISDAELDQLAADYESALRAVCGKQGLPDEWEEKLSGIPRTSSRGRLKRVIWLAIYSELHSQSKARSVAAPEAEEAARKLLRREPVRVEIGPHVVHVTARSYAAMAEIARHDQRIRMLAADLHYLDGRMLAASTELAGAVEGRGSLRRYLRRYAKAYGAVSQEILRQRRALWAHALTPNGAPARDLSSLPDWWDEIDSAWDGALLRGVMEAGVVRYIQMGPPPKRKSRKEEEGEEFGWGSLFASIERQQSLPPASLYDRDLFQTLAWVRAGAPPVPAELKG